MTIRKMLIDSFKAAVAAADPLTIVPEHLPRQPKGRTIVLGAGKAAASMAKAVEENWPQGAPLEGLVVTRYGHGTPTRRIRVVEAAHPVPDGKGADAAREILALARSAGPDDLLLVLISGGGSSLLSLPADGLAMEDLRAITKDLLKSGAPIQEMNTVRKHLSAIQGGRLAAASTAPVLALIISDVTGDDPTHIASGPTAPDPTTFADVQEILTRYRITPPSAVVEHLRKGVAGEINETPKPDDPLFGRVENRVIASAYKSLLAAEGFFHQQGITPCLLGDTVTGEAAEVAKVFGALARQIRNHAEPFQPPVVLISGGETTVTVRGNGRGGRNTEFLLSLAIDLEGLRDTYAISAGTDGIDGTQDNAGAIATPDTLQRAHLLGLNAKALLGNNDAYSFFAALNDLVVVGPTLTNVNDYRAILLL